MTSIVKLRQSASTKHQKFAEKMFCVLHERGFDAADLDELVYRLAEQIGESRTKIPFKKDRCVDEELEAAEELNSMSMQDQLIFLAAYFKNKEEFISALEVELSIRLMDVVLLRSES